MRFNGSCGREGSNLRDFSEKHIDETMQGVAGREFDNALFFNCVFDDIKGTTFKHCDLNHSTFKTDKIEDLLGATITLDCNSFGNVELSPLIFDLILVLLTKSRGNTEKRKQLVEVLGRERVLELLTQMKDLER